MKSLILNYLSSFFASIFGALVVVFSTDSLQVPDSGLFLSWFLILFFLGLVLTLVVVYFSHLRKDG